MQSIKAVIIEDSPKDSLLLKGALAQDYSEIEVVGIYPTLMEGIIAIRKHRPQVVFLDIELPQYSGMDISKFLDENERNFEIILSTFHHQFAIESYELDAIAYLTKPISTTKLKMPIKRPKKRLEQKSALQKIGFIKKVLTEKDDTRIPISTSEGHYFFSPDEIIYFKADGAYTEIFTKGRKLYSGRNIKYFEELLAIEKSFMRVHRSYFINLKKVALYQTKENIIIIILKDNSEVQLSPQKINEFHERMSAFNK